MVAKIYLYSIPTCVNAHVGKMHKTILKKTGAWMLPQNCP